MKKFDREPEEQGRMRYRLVAVAVLATLVGCDSSTEANPLLGPFPVRSTTAHVQLLDFNHDRAIWNEDGQGVLWDGRVTRLPFRAVDLGPDGMILGQSNGQAVVWTSGSMEAVAEGTAYGFTAGGRALIETPDGLVWWNPDGTIGPVIREVPSTAHLLVSDDGAILGQNPTEYPPPDEEGRPSTHCFASLPGTLFTFGSTERCVPLVGTESGLYLHTDEQGLRFYGVYGMEGWGLGFEAWDINVHGELIGDRDTTALGLAASGARISDEGRVLVLVAREDDGVNDLYVVDSP